MWAPQSWLPALEHGLHSCDARASLLCGIWDLPRSGLKLRSPALAGRFFTTELPGKPTFFKLKKKKRNYASLFGSKIQVKKKELNIGI